MASRLRLIVYDKETIEEHEDVSLAAAVERAKEPTMGWIVLEEPSEEDYALLEAELELHPLALEDCRNERQRPKVEEYSTNTYIVVRSIEPDEEEGVRSRQINMFLGRGWLLVIGERPDGLFDGVRDRLRRGRQRIRSSGSDYLAYTLIDAAVDTYLPVVQEMGERIEVLEDAIFDDVHKEHLEEVQALKLDLRRMRRHIRPMKDAVAYMLRDETTFKRGTQPFLRDVLDHTAQAADLVESHRDATSHLMDLYLTMVSNRTNDIMKTLTLVATIFIPLSFFAGVYGMNFDTALPGNMPELHMPYGYVGFWAVALLIGIGNLVYFRHRGWI
ncbi:MAG: magnesium/cobalt transporter CorA [Euryarchaeota archaeon]|nr:magnesium/cobalt transporter CorA [Euryarchaeota archaeon]